MEFKGATPAPSDNGAALTAQLLTNDQVNQIVEDTAVLNTGIVRGNVVKFSVSLSKWVACDGTVALEETDTIGVVTYANGTSGQVKTSGVYVDADLSTLGKYYCQSDGTIGQTATKVFIGTVSSPGRLCLPGGGGGGVQPATVDTLGGIIVGEGLRVTTDGILSAGGHQLFTSSGTFTAVTDTVYVTGCGGGGAGYGGSTPTVTAGGATSFGSLLTLSGGGAGTAENQGASGGFGGGSAWRSGIHEYDSNVYYYGHGGDSLFGVGGHGLEPVAATGYGAGGAPKTSNTDYNNPGGGGGAQCALKQALTVIPGQTYTVTIGAAGTNNKISALNGTAGFLLVEW